MTILRRFRSRHRAPWSLAAALLVAACGLAADVEPAFVWRIAINGGADDHGEIVLSFAEAGVEATQISAAIPKGTPENHVADRVRRALRHSLPKDVYRVDIKGGEKIIVAAPGQQKDYAIRLVRNTVPGTEIEITRESREN